MMDRRIGQHDPDARHAGATLRASAPRLVHQDDGPRGMAQQRQSAGVGAAKSETEAALATMTREGLGRRAFLRGRNCVTAASFRRVADQMEAADPLQRDDLARAQGGDDFGRLMDRRGPHSGQAIGLGMEAAVGRVGVIGGAVRAHRKAAMRRLRAVIRQMRASACSADRNAVQLTKG